MAKRGLTQKEYVRRGGLICPFCLHEIIRVGDVEVCTERVYRNCFCPQCKKEWTDIFKLSGYCK